MEKETYKKAKEILEKFDPTRFKKLEVSSFSFSVLSIGGSMVLVKPTYAVLSYLGRTITDHCSSVLASADTGGRYASRNTGFAL